MLNSYWQARLEELAVIFENMLDSSSVSIETFKQLLAEYFGVDW